MFHCWLLQVSQVIENIVNDQQLPGLPQLQPPPSVLIVPLERQQPQGLFTAEMLTSALQGSNTSSPISDPPTYSAEHSRSPPARFSHDDLRGALEGALRIPTTTANHQHSHYPRRSGYEASRRAGQSSRREDGYEFRRERQERRERWAPHRRETSRRHNPSVCCIKISVII